MITGGMMDTLLGKLFNSKELDLRTEMDELFTGEDFSEKKGIVFIHRKLKRKQFHDNQKCHRPYYKVELCRDRKVFPGFCYHRTII